MNQALADEQPSTAGAAADSVQPARGDGETDDQTLLSAVGEAVALCEVVVDAGGRPTDYRFLEVNASARAPSGPHSGLE